MHPRLHIEAAALAAGALLVARGEALDVAPGAERLAARTAGSAARRVIASDNAACISPVSALRASGRFMVRVATPSSKVSISWLVMGLSLLPASERRAVALSKGLAAK